MGAALIQADGRTRMTKVLGADRDHVNAPKKSSAEQNERAKWSPCNAILCIVVAAINVRCNNTKQIGSRTVNVFLVNGHITEYHTRHFIQSVANSCAVALPIWCDTEVTKHPPIHRYMTKRDAP